MQVNTVILLNISEGAFGIIGVVVGSLLGSLSTILLDRYNRSKHLYLDVGNAKFYYPTGEYREEPLLGYFSIYIYNDSSLPKSFLLEKLKLEDSNIIFTVVNKETNKLASGIVHRVESNNGLKLMYNLEVRPDIDIQVPEINNKNAILSYRIGKRSFNLVIPLSYYDII